MKVIQWWYNVYLANVTIRQCEKYYLLQIYSGC